MLYLSTHSTHNLRLCLYRTGHVMKQPDSEMGNPLLPLHESGEMEISTKQPATVVSIVTSLATHCD